MDLERAEIDLPFNVRVYEGGFIGLAPITYVHDVHIWLHSEMDHVENITIRRNGSLQLFEHAHTSDSHGDNFVEFNVMRIQDDGYVEADTSAVHATHRDMHFNISSLYVEGGGQLMGTSLFIDAGYIKVDNGGYIHSNGYGYCFSESGDDINVGRGTYDGSGSSGAGHGGTSGRGAGSHDGVDGHLTGQPYGHLFEPITLGSAGGGNSDAMAGCGGGYLHITVAELQNDGDIQVNGQEAQQSVGGGGSAGSMQIHVDHIEGTGNFTANGGSAFEEASSNARGGGGAGGRIAMYLTLNQTFTGTFQAHGGNAYYTTSHPAEPGGPGTSFIHHLEHLHTTLIIDNNNLVSHSVATIEDYADLSTDSFKAWILPSSGEHWLAGGEHEYK